MEEQFIEFLKNEKSLADKLLALSEKLRDALMKYDKNLVEKISESQHHIAVKLKEMEEMRIRFLVTQFKISRMDASKLKLSEIEDKFSNEIRVEIKKIRIAMKRIAKQLAEVNSENRILSNKAKNSVNSIITQLDLNSSRKVCDVTV